MVRSEDSTYRAAEVKLFSEVMLGRGAGLNNIFKVFFKVVLMPC